MTPIGSSWGDPSADTSEHAAQEARRMFHRFLAAWAMEVLALQRNGLDRPCVRDPWETPAPTLRQAA